jgi:hypothetical protein
MASNDAQLYVRTRRAVEAEEELTLDYAEVEAEILRRDPGMRWAVPFLWFEER